MQRQGGLTAIDHEQLLLGDDVPVGYGDHGAQVVCHGKVNACRHCHLHARSTLVKREGMKWKKESIINLHPHTGRTWPRRLNHPARKHHRKASALPAGRGRCTIVQQ